MKKVVNMKKQKNIKSKKVVNMKKQKNIKSKKAEI